MIGVSRCQNLQNNSNSVTSSTNNEIALAVHMRIVLCMRVDYITDDSCYHVEIMAVQRSQYNL